MPRSLLHPFLLAGAAVLIGAPVAAQVGPSSSMFRGNPEHTGASNSRFFAGQGGVRWSVHTGGPVRSSPAVTKRRVIVGSGDGFLYAIERASGRIAWRFKAGGAVDASPAVARGVVVAATLQGRIFAVDEVSGSLRWSLQTGPALPLNTTHAGGWDLWASSPAIVGQTVLIGGQDGLVYALDLLTGTTKWRARTGGRVRASPAVHHGVVVVGSWDGRLYALDLATGVERWVYRTVGDTADIARCGYDCRAIQGSAAIDGGQVFVGSRDGGLYALDLATGSRQWRASHRGSWIIGSPAVHDGRVFDGSSDAHFIQAVDAASGQELWHLPVGANVLSSPLWVGGVVVVGTHPTNAPWGDLLAIDAASGTVRWRLRLDDQINSSPVAADGELYLGTEGGEILAIAEVNPVIPRMAVFYDPAISAEPFAAGTRLAFEYFRELGYEPLDSEGLARFCADRIADGVPSAVVMAMDLLPKSVAPVRADTVLIRRYLDAGGKVVSFSAVLGGAVRDSTGRVRGDDPAALEELLGIPASAMDYDQDPGTPTAAGRLWGIDRTVRGDYTMEVSAVSVALALDPRGRATAWVQIYRPERPGSGYVQLWGLGATVDRLPMIRAVTEYGLLRRDTAQ
jgi:eukaryotic-like serine/threonine-protein kinase